MFYLGLAVITNKVTRCSDAGERENAIRPSEGQVLGAKIMRKTFHNFTYVQASMIRAGFLILAVSAGSQAGVDGNQRWLSISGFKPSKAGFDAGADSLSSPPIWHDRIAQSDIFDMRSWLVSVVMSHLWGKIERRIL